MKPTFKPGANIAMKVPSHEHARTVSFYRDVLGFEEVPDKSGDGSVVFQFGDKYLWIDDVPTLSQAEIWLEVVTDDLSAASKALAQAECSRRDQIEPLPDGYEGFWVSNPANIIHLVTAEDE